MTVLSRFLVFPAAMTLAAISGVVQAADAVKPEPGFASDKKWEIIVTPMHGLLAWGVHGKIKGRNTDTANISLTPIEFWQQIDDILNVLDFVGLPTVEVRRGRFGVTADIFTVSLQADVPARGLVISGISTSFETTMATFTGSYRFLQTEKALVDVIGGARLWNANFSLNVAGGVILPGAGITTKETWVDPVVGLAAQYDLTERLYLGGYGLVGGGANSDVTWDIYPKVGYRLRKDLDLFAGFRYFGVNYSNNGIVYDLGIYSPSAGVTLRF